MTEEELRRREAVLRGKLATWDTEMARRQTEAKHTADVAAHTREILDDLDAQFRARTKFNKVDTSFLFLATALQIARQYCVTQFTERVDSTTAANSTPGHTKETSDRKHRLYHPSLEEILTNPVPFDASYRANGALSGGGKMGHRVTAIGHDPVLGLVFGTANIATSTLTNVKMESFHIYTGDAPTRNGGIAKRDVFYKRASTGKVLDCAGEDLLYGGTPGRERIAASLLKEIVHLKSDLNTPRSLPLPFVSVISPHLANQLASYGLDMANITAVTAQASLAALINTLVAMIHGAFYLENGTENRTLYEVKTRKILSYSNLIASSTNLAVTAITKDMRKLDLGGLAVTLFQLINNKKFIQEVEESFVFGSYQQLLDDIPEVKYDEVATGTRGDGFRDPIR